MPVYEYKGLDAGGKPVSGIVDADSAKAARSRLRKQGLFPTDIHEQAGGGTRGSGLNIEIDLSKYLQFISPRDVALLTTQLSTLIGAHVPMSEALSALVEQVDKSKLKIAMSRVKERVNEGGTLADALGEHPKIFDELYVQMVRAGEKSGALSEVLKRLAKFTEAQVKLQGQLISALAYPLLMAAIGLTILLGLFMGVLPRIRQLFASMGGEEALPLLTRAVFFFGDTLVALWWALPLLAVGGWLLIRRIVQTERGRETFDRMKLKLPVFGKINRLVAVSRFCRTLATLLVSGVPIISALQIVEAVVGNVVLAQAIKEAAVNIQEGQSIAVPLKQSGEFPPLVTHMIAIGERTGELEAMLTSVADAYEDQVEATVGALTSLLAPMMIVVMGGVIFLVALGLLMPMMNLSQVIR